MVRRLLPAAIAVGTALSVIAPVSAAEEVNIYNSRHYNTDRALYETFTKDTGIRVNMIEGGADELQLRIEQEGAGSKADMLITVDAGRLVIARDKGILQPVKSAAIDAAIPATLRDPEGYWVGLSTRARVIYYAKGRINPADVASYESLADAKLKGKLLIRSSTNVYNVSLVGALIARNGAEATETWARGVVANLARAPKGGDTDQILAVAAGEGDVAVGNTYYYMQLLTSKDPARRAAAEKVGLVFPNQAGRGTHVNISGAGVVKTAPNRANAVRLLEYLVSPTAQRYFADGNFEYPANPTVPAHPELTALGAFKADDLNAAEFARRSAESARLTDRAGWK